MEAASMERTGTVGKWLPAFSQALKSFEPTAAAAMFHDTSYWRDILAFTWDLQTIEGRPAIRQLLSETLPVLAETGWTAEAESADESEGFISFETSVGRGRGYIRLVDGKCLSILTAMEELKGFEEQRREKRPVSIPGDASGNWHDRLQAERRELGFERQPYVLIVGGGQGGLGLAARLRQLQVPTIVVDRFARSGDQWRARYASLSLHDPVWYDHMPYLPFPDTWPVFTPKDKLADWLESYETLMELNVWHSTECTAAHFDQAASRWDVTLKRGDDVLHLQPTHLVLAIGNAGKPVTPSFAGATTFKGQQWHSSEFPGGRGLAGERVVVIGSNNSAHDICADLVDHGALPIMIQRSSTFIIPQDELVETLGGRYSEEAAAKGLTTDRADILNAATPLRLIASVHQSNVVGLRRRKAAYYAALEAAGFMLDFGLDDTGLLKYLRTASGYYIDVGASSLVMDGSIALRSQVEVTRIEPDGVRLSSGELLKADIIIYATGFGSMDQRVADLIDPDVSQRVGKAWGYGSGTRGDPGPWEGEIRNMWKPTAQTGLWFHGGNLAQSRFYSLFLALQIKARLEEVPTAVYRSGIVGIDDAEF